MSLPALLDWHAVHGRLRLIFPDGVPDRSFLVREATARTIFVALYVGAIDGSERWIAPRHVVRMSDAQAEQRDEAARLAYHSAMNRTKSPSPPGRWYADNTREPLRDEVIRQGLVPANAMIERGGLPSTSPLGRYALRQAFAELFDPELSGAKLEQAAEEWRSHNLSAAALARTALVRTGAITASGNIAIHFPAGPSIILPPGPSQRIMKAVIEVFAPAFLGDPVSPGSATARASGRFAMRLWNMRCRSRWMRRICCRTLCLLTSPHQDAQARFLSCLWRWSLPMAR